ncbi:4'-phosphopantetheinyl transferase family protein [Janthinobacterium fluminis]|uniref:4'-phosphopantetheinyl transferase superfamily protein n=1 Tax=Janthinobacterium fluminis TaxID=2987524 RepID=A0ABT5K0C6_9BURK|nr:4'-phosphopantetheinyl transferase superfamily protein [Janthinobacterium fluminis]MDC8758418.1 4'-phosphopantetheinyl transferase superfamily protein [Janthinobacterium fluminis]
MIDALIPPGPRGSVTAQGSAPAMPHDALGRLALRPGAVDVWVALTDAMPAELMALLKRVLNDDERCQQTKFMFEKDRRRYLLTRALVRYVLSRYVPLQPAEWRFAATSHGRPFIVNRHPGVQGLTFNISHSDQVVVLGVTRDSALGIDVEDLQRNVPLDIAESFFSAAEVRQLQSTAPALQARRFLDFWTLKESYIKARGKGLSLPLEQFGFELRGERQLQAHFDPCLDDAPDNWTFWQWHPSPDSIAALCVENRPGMETAITVRRTLPFAWEESMRFEALRASST